MRRLLLVLISGCTVADPNTVSSPEEAEVAQALIEPCPVGQWCNETPAGIPSSAKLASVWAVNADDVFAVGDNGTILRRLNGTEWTAMESGTTNNLRAVWASSSTDVWAGGSSGTLLHFDGTAWSPVSASIPSVASISGTSASDVWFAGGSVVLHWNGSTFSSFLFTATLLSIHTPAPNDVWLTSEGSHLRHYTGTNWPVATMVLPSTLFAVFAITPTDVWGVSGISNKEAVHLVGTRWFSMKTAKFKALSALAADNVWAAGNSFAGRWNGTAWTVEEPFGVNTSLWSVTTTPGHVWVSGTGLLAHREL